VRDNQSATQVNTIRQGKLVSLLAKGETKSAENGTSGIHRTW